MAMDLYVNGNLVSTDPDEARIEQELRALNGGDCFAILGPTGMTYIQTSGGSSAGFDLEYQDGSTSRHYHCISDHLDLSTVTRAFRLYHRGDARWRSELRWQPMVI
jgi:hypothetical protein